MNTSHNHMCLHVLQKYFIKELNDVYRRASLELLMPVMGFKLTQVHEPIR